MRRKLSKLVGTGFYTEALSLFSKLHFQSHPLNEFTFPFLLKACSKLKVIPHGQMLHAHLTKTGFNSDIYTATSLTDMYMKFVLLASALKVFDEISQPNTTLINVLVSGFSQNGCYEKSLDVFRRVSEYGLRPDSATIASLLSGCNNAVKDGFQVHCWAIKIGVETDIYVATSLVTMYSNCKDPVTASIVFERICDKNVACYNAFVTGLLQNRIHQPIFEVFKEMLRWSNQNPNSGSFVTILSACSDLKNLKFGRQIHGFLIKLDLLLDVLVGTALLDMYSKCGYWHWAYDIFHELCGFRSLITWNSMISGMMMNGESENAIGLFMMLESDGLKPDSATWNSMISGFTHLGKANEAFLFFRKMQSFGETPGKKSITSLLSACASLSTLVAGKEIHGHSIRTGINYDEFLATALVNMYMKCGRSSWALSVFNQFEIKPKKPVIWNAMISGYGQNGESEAAFEMFEWMKRENVEPNSSTFNCLLSVCSHGGKVEKGLGFFSSMKGYGLVPNSLHYSCMIDILGRSGRINEARELLSKMPEVSGSVLGSLLGASRFHSDLKLGEEMAGLLAEMDPESSTPFVMLSNIYAGEGRWKDVKELRDEMDRKRLEKIGGFSSVSER
ncbi:pentatricopeptide repeat-containing protein At2g02750 [Cynara cardunculus var. scolymus]|uniref:pentatricopeptide repeat-containing protein At2g02750 n=1 Tax=Cynara cardunculus var. scolymus TaxID=59895 RepID=UPI000D629C70|nr:pentatricopeptide repeat-containing protein At2g02750 [Cynara cardunculus var. scolymus]